MEANIDNFINYTDSPSLFLAENFPELDFGFRSPETEISLTNNPPATTPTHSSDPSNHFSNVHSVRGPASHTGSGHRSPDTMTSSPDDESRYTSSNTNISANSKKIQKRGRDEKKVKAKIELEQLLATTARKYIPEGIDDPNLDDKTKRKMVQMVKNRVAAQKTRDKRKNYMSELEEVKSRLDDANNALNERNRLLELRVRELESAQARLLAENEELKRGGQFGARSMQQIPPPQQMQYPVPQQQIHHPNHPHYPNHPNMQAPQPNMQPALNPPHYPSLPSTPQHLMQPRFQSMTSMGSFDGFSFPQSNRLVPNNHNNSHTTITIENNDNSQNSGNNQQFSNPFPVLSRGSSGKRNTYGYLLAITMVLACFTTLNIETGKIVHTSHNPNTPTDNNPTDPPATPDGPVDPTTTGGPGLVPEITTTTDTGGTDTGEPGTDTGEPGTDTGEPNTNAAPLEGEPGTDTGDNEPSVSIDAATNNGTGTNDHNGERSKPKGSSDSSGEDDTNSEDSTSVATLFSTDEGTDEGTDTNNGKDTDGPIKFNTLDVKNHTNNTNTTSTADIIRSKNGQIPGANHRVGRMLVLTEILDEIDALNRDY